MLGKATPELPMSALTHFAETEIIAAAELPNPRKFALDLKGLPAYLPNRNVYVYLEMKASVAASVILAATIEAWLAGEPRGLWPTWIGDISALSTSKSLPNLFTGGGAAVSGTNVLKLASPFTTSTQIVILQPKQFTGKIDRLAVHIDGFSALTSTVQGWRGYLACESYAPQ